MIWFTFLHNHSSKPWSDPPIFWCFYPKAYHTVLVPGAVASQHHMMSLQGFPRRKGACCSGFVHHSHVGATNTSSITKPLAVFTWVKKNLYKSVPLQGQYCLVGLMIAPALSSCCLSDVLFNYGNTTAHLNSPRETAFLSKLPSHAFTARLCWTTSIHC